MSGGLPAGALQAQSAAGVGQQVQHAQAGLWWPAADPARLRAAAAAWRGLATDLEAVTAAASAVVRSVAAQNQGRAVDALEAYWGSRWVGGGGALPAAAEGARALAVGLEGYAAAVDKARARIEELIAAAATAAVIGIGLTVVTVGISDVAAGAVAGSLIAAAAAVGIELSAEVAAIVATGLLFTGVGALEGALSDLAIQGERIGYFHDQTAIEWGEVLQFSAVGAATGGATIGAAATADAVAPTAGRILARLTETGTETRLGDQSLVELTARDGEGLREDPLRVLSDQEIRQIKAEFREIGGDPGKLEFNVGIRTGYTDEPDTIRIRGDVFPTSSPTATHPRSIMSTRAVLAHELGHAHYRGTELPPGYWADEFRASYWASRNVPGLSVDERTCLVKDALSRASENGVPVRENRFILEMLSGFRAEG